MACPKWMEDHCSKTVQCLADFAQRTGSLLVSVMYWKFLSITPYLSSCSKFCNDSWPEWPLVEAFHWSSSSRPSALRDWIMLGVLLFSFLASQALGYTCTSFAVKGPWFSHFRIVFNFFLASCRRYKVSMFAYVFILSSCTSLAASVVQFVFPLWSMFSTNVMEACLDSSYVLLWR